jgi:predicted acyl esterase
MKQKNVKWVNAHNQVKGKTGLSSCGVSSVGHNVVKFTATNFPHLASMSPWNNLNI